VAQQPEQPSKVESWAYPFPLKPTSGTSEPSPEACSAALALAEDGFYPIGANGLWHGGIHFGAETAGKFDQDGGVKCIADGEVVAFRLDKELQELTYPEGIKAGYSKGFTLVRHRLVLPTPPAQPAGGNGTSQTPPAPASTPAQNSTPPTSAPAQNSTPPAADVLTFFSLYMHTLPLDGYGAGTPLQGHAKTLPAYYGASQIYSVGSKASDPRLTAQGHPDHTTLGLRVRASASAHASVLGWLASGTKVKIGEKHGQWGKITSFVSGAAESYKEGVTVSASASSGWVFTGQMDPETQPPSALDQVYILPKPQRILAGETVAYIGEYQRLVEARAHHKLSPKLGERPLLHVEVFTGDDLNAYISRSRARAQQLDPKSRTLLLISKGAKLVQPSSPDTSIPSGTAVKAAPDSPDSGPWCKVSKVGVAGHPTTGQAPLWIARADLQGTGARQAWSQFPLSVQSAGGPPAAWTRVANTSSSQHCAEAANKTWYAVSIGDENNAQVDGWVCDHGHPLVELKSPWDWPGFDVVSLGTSVSDMFQRALFIADSGTPDEITRFEDSFNSARSDETIKRLEDAIDGQKERDGKITANELQLALGKPWLADRIDHLIVRYESEWGGEMSKWDALDSQMHAGLPVWKAEKTRIDALRFWSGMSGVTGWPSTANVWHFHPVGIVSNFLSTDCNCTADMTRAQLKRIATYATNADIDAYIDSLNEAFRRSGMSTCMSRVHFLAQVLHESGEFRYTRETGDSLPYDPWRGRGLIQLTGEINYSLYQSYSGEDVTSNLVAMRKLESAPHAMLSAAWYFCVQSRGLKAGDDDDFIWATRLINGGLNHYDDRLAYVNRAIAVLGLQSCAKLNHHGTYLFRESRAYEEKRASFAWGLWNDPGLHKPGKQKNAADAKEGYQRYLELDSQDGHPVDAHGRPKDKGWYYIGENVYVFDYANQRLQQLNSQGG
jgi:predicted chitinase